MSLEMEIVDSFQFADGRLVLIGTLTGEERLEIPCEADLYVAGDWRARVEVMSERMPGPKLRHDQKVVEVRNNVGIDLKSLKTAKLVFVARGSVENFSDQGKIHD